MFEEFWKMYPKKVSRRDAEKAWNKLDMIDRAEVVNALPNHIKYWIATNGTDKTFIPYPATWLNQARWEDELEMPQSKPKTDVAWWSTEATVIAKGQEVGLSPRPGEDIHTFKGRVVDKLRSAA
jgi:hypothetical protein